MDILRFITAGSVDDGKSTLIGRLLYDTNSIAEDQLEAIAKASKHKEDGEIDLALLTDGLRAEREQGITIDVAYKYFSTEKRKFIIADAPGHIQYTRNMVTGASNAQLAIILIDARHGVTEQTKRHTYIAHLLGIEHLVIAVNKMDLRDYSQEVFSQIQTDYQQFFLPLQTQAGKAGSIVFIPMAALQGDNIVVRSEQMAWYTGQTLLEHLEQVTVHQGWVEKEARFQVQYVIRPQTDALHDYRGYAGKVLSGVYKQGDAITVLPSGLQTHIKALEFAEKEITEAFAPMSVIIHTTEDIDISRGDTLVKVNESPALTQEIEAAICWMDTKPLKAGAKYLLQYNSKRTRCAVRDLIDKTDIQTLAKLDPSDSFALNDIGTVHIKTAEMLPLDHYTHNKANGCFILIDEQTNNTVAAGMVQNIL